MMPSMTTGRKRILELLAEREHVTRGQMIVEFGSSNQSVKDRCRLLLNHGLIEVALIRKESNQGRALEHLGITDAGRQALIDAPPKPIIRVDLGIQRALAARVLVEGAPQVGFDPSQLLDLKRSQTKEMQARDVLIWAGRQRGIACHVLADVFKFDSNSTPSKVAARIQKKLEQEDPEMMALCAQIVDRFK